MGHNQSRPGSRKLDLSSVGVHFSAIDPFTVLEEVVSKWKEKKLFTADELSKLDSEKSAKGKVKYLLNVLINQDGNTNEKIMEIFEGLSKIGVGFNNLPEELDILYQSVEETQKDGGKNKQIRIPATISEETFRRTASCSTQQSTNTQFGEVCAPLLDDSMSSRSFSLSYNNKESPTVDEMAEDLLDSSIEFRHKKAVVIVMDPSDLTDADKLHDMLSSGHKPKTTASSSLESQADHKVVEVLHQLNKERTTLVRAVVSQPSKHKTFRKKKQHQEIVQQSASDSVLFNELKRKVMEALLKKEKSAESQSYPLSVFIKAQNATLCRDFFSMFLMGSNCLYLFIYNWREQTAVFDRSGGAETFLLNEILKWVHTIGSTACSIQALTPSVSAMVVTTKFDELVGKIAGESQVAKQVGNASTHKLCELLKGHRCAAILDSKPILLSHSKEDSKMRGEADILMKKLANSNFPGRSINPRWVHLLFEVCEKRSQPVLLMEDFLKLASSVTLGEQDAHDALNCFKEAKLVFYLPESSTCELKNIIFTDIEWLINTLVATLTPPSFQARGTLWQDWEDLTKKGIMSEDIKKDIETRLNIAIAPSIKLRLPDQWVFMLLHEVNLFTDLSTDEKVKGFCPLYLQVCDEQTNTQVFSNSSVPPVYLRPNTGCITDQYMMRLFCCIIRYEFPVLQDCQSRTRAVFLLKKHNLRFTISCSLDCLKIEVESSFTGKSLDCESGSKAAQMLVSCIVSTSRKLGETWYPVILGDQDQTEEHPNQFFQCCDQQCSYFCKGTLHLSKVIRGDSEFPHLECELSGQCCTISEAEKFWVNTSSQKEILFENPTPTATPTPKAKNRRTKFAKRHYSSSQDQPVLRTSPVAKREIKSLYLQLPSSTEPYRKSLPRLSPMLDGSSRSSVMSSSAAPAPPPGDEGHILDRYFKVMHDYLGVDMVAMRMMELKLMEPAQALAICNKDSFKSTAERAEAVHEIIKVVREKGAQGFMLFVRILEQTGASYVSHQKIIEELQDDPTYASFLK